MESRKYSKEYMESLKPSYNTLLAKRVDAYYRAVMGYLFLKIREPFRQDEPVYPKPFRKRRGSPFHSTRKHKYNSRKCPTKRGLKLIDTINVSEIIDELDIIKKVKLQLENARRELGFEEDMGPYLWKLTECIAEAEDIINQLVSILKKRGYIDEVS